MRGNCLKILLSTLIPFSFFSFYVTIIYQKFYSSVILSLPFGIIECFILFSKQSQMCVNLFAAWTCVCVFLLEGVIYSRCSLNRSGLGIYIDAETCTVGIL